jgi:hypothetical protein
MVKAVARAFRWREQLENGTHATITEIAAAERIRQLHRAAARGAGYQPADRRGFFVSIFARKRRASSQL